MNRLWLAATIIIALALALFAPGALAQDCPRGESLPTVASAVRTLEGQLVFHDGLRAWFELKLDQPQCGEGSIELMQFDSTSKEVETLRGCRVRSSGRIDFSPSGYFTLNLYQDVTAIEPVGACARQAAFPVFPDAKPDKRVRAYRVDISVIYGPGDHPVDVQVQSEGRALHPWQAYANYWMTGGFVLYGHCGEGFVVDAVFGTPEAKPSHFDTPRTSTDMASFDPESAAARDKWDLHLGYTCLRDPLRDDR